MREGEGARGSGAGGAGREPRCTVVMPVYNTPEEFLREAVESILHQTFGDFELIVVDDGSEAYVRELIESYNDARVRYLRMGEQSGAAVARNRALDEARGEFVAFMDSDDISLPERLAKQVAYLEAHPEVGCLGTAYRVFDGKHFKKGQATPLEHERIVSYLLFCGCAFCQSGVMLRRAVLEAAPTPLRYRAEYKVAQDCVLWFDLIGRTRFAALSEELVCYRVHPQSISGRSHAQQVQKMGEAQAELLARYSGAPFGSKETWPRLLAGATLTRGEYAEVSRQLLQAAAALQQQGYGSAAVLGALRQRLRKAFLRTHSLRGQWELLRLPVRRQAGLPLWWCCYTFVTRGIF